MSDRALELRRLELKGMNLRIKNFAARLCSGTTVCPEEIAQDAYFDAWRTAGDFRGESNFSTWALGIVRYKFLSALRKAVFEAKRFTDIGPNTDVDTVLLNTYERPQEEVVWLKARQRAVWDSLYELSPAHREIVLLVYYRELRIDEAALIVGIPAATAKTRLFYARAHLRNILKSKGIHSYHESIDRGGP